MIEFKALRVPALTEEVAIKLQMLFHDLPGIEQFTITIATHELQIVFDEDRLDFHSLIEVMAKAGCPLRSINAVLLKQIPHERR